MKLLKPQFALILSLLLAGNAYPQSQETPELVVRNFYKWYLTELSEERNPRADRATVLKASSRRLGRWYYSPAYSEWGADYFLNAQDIDEHWAKYFAVSKAVIKGNTASTMVTFTVPKTSDRPAYKRILPVKLIKEAGLWKIDIVDNLWPES